MAIDPICGMNVDEQKGRKTERDGKAYYFCSQKCQDKFAKNQEGPSQHKPRIKQEEPKGQKYICPMHPEIEQDHPGDCPKCGMALEPKNASLEDKAGQREIKILGWKFWGGLFLGLP